MLTIGAFEAKTHLSSLLDRASRGEEITITKKGVPVAKLVPVEAQKSRGRSEIIAKLKEFGKDNKLPEGMTVRDMINEGRCS